MFIEMPKFHETSPALKSFLLRACHGIRKKCDMSQYCKQLLYFNLPSGAEKSFLIEYHRIEENIINIHH